MLSLHFCSTMGVCLCKDKVEAENADDLSLYADTRCNRVERLSDQVDELVKETLLAIASIVDDEPGKSR